MHESVSHYRLIERLGAGGMGEVWKAEDLKLQRTVAIKFVTQRIIDDPESKERITEEARAAAAINHPNIATVYEIGEDAGRLFIAMEYVEGQTLRSRIEQGPLALTDALDLAIQIAEALNAAHTRGLIHCDIKDSNVMVTPDGAAKVLDFGLAKTRADLATAPSRPEVRVQTNGTALVSSNLNQDSRSLAGTLHYLAPEQIRSEEVNGQTDLFSLGVVLYQMLTARLPFDGDGHASVLKEILDAEPRPIGVYRDDVPLELEDAVRKALEKDRNDRYGTAEAMLARLKAVRTRLEISTVPVAREAAALVSDEEREESRPRRLIDRQFWNKAQFMVWRFRRWIAAAGAIVTAAAALDFLFGRGGGQSLDLTLSIFALLCFAAAYAARRYRPNGPPQSRLSGAAFRGLLPFQEADRDRFYGRDVETAALFDLITNDEFRFGVLFGDSGSGKTSLLRAGLMPRFWEAGFVPIFCRSYNDPMTALVEQCRRQSQLAPLEEEEPVDYLNRVTDELNAGLVVFCDQFEEFFVNFRTKLEREPFISFIASCHHKRRLPVKFLFSMRSDFLYLIGADFDGRIDEPLLSSRRYHLRNLDRQQAAGIIERSVERAGLPFAPGLSGHIAGDLAVDDAVLPSELQIVGEQLQNRRIFTLEEYRRVGGKEQLVHSYLEDVIRAAGDQDAARLLLRSLISDENTRLTLTLAEITRRTQRAGKEVESLLEAFAEARLVREIQDEEPWRYELMHEYLIEKINQVTGRVMDAAQRANRLLRQYLSDYSLDKTTRIPVGKLWFIKRYADTASGERARELL
ncbi:MAG TPA: serine/threonine-protein kinase, partial [Blastocatellia bacterium]|nr:serine/threonine-protein kinase [Blastocatellia bacterium]